MRLQPRSRQAEARADRLYRQPLSTSSASTTTRPSPPPASSGCCSAPQIHVQVVRPRGSDRRQPAGRAVLPERASHAVYFLQEQEMTCSTPSTISVTASPRCRAAPSSAASAAPRAAAARTASRRPRAAWRRSRRIAVNLNQKAKNGKIDPPIGREAEVNRTIQAVPPHQEQPALCRRSRRGQDRDRRGPGAPHRPGRRARGPEERRHLCARHGAPWRNALSRRF